MPPLDVAIVGGGAGGLSAAAAILTKRPELKVGVFERESRLKKSGGFVALAKNGQNALKALQPRVWDRVEKEFMAHQETVAIQFGTEIVNRVTSSNPTKSVAWCNLRQALSEVLPRDCLQLGCELQDLVQEDDGVSLSFSSLPEPYHAKVVIGCDGYRSQVRELCLQDGPPTFRNKILWQGVIKWPEYWPYTKLQFLFMVEDKIGVVATALDAQSLGWQCMYTLEELNENSLPHTRSVQLAPSGEECKKHCLDALEGSLPEHLVRAIKDTPAEFFTEDGCFARHPDSCGVWGKGPITLLGDAAHLSSPALAQGTSQALIDAVELGRAIGDLGACDEALRQYESVRIDAVQPVQQGSWDVSSGLLTEGEWRDQNPWLADQVIEPL